ncbi:hypothetical protein PPYR_15578, partial [Photinus pyralis]
FGNYDHIIVGAGSSGAVIAARLCENSTKRILLIEAGGNETDLTDIPAMGTLAQTLEYNWNYQTTPQNRACLLNDNRRCVYPAGRGLGGSTIINSLIYSRGSAADYNVWGLENPGWSFGDLLPFFKTVENYKIPADSCYHGYDGPVNVDYPRPLLNAKSSAFVFANQELGIEVGDYNGANPLRVGVVQSNIIEGQRASTGRAYIQPSLKRCPNLEVLTRSYATKVLMNPTTKRASGVFFARDKKFFVAKATNEIVLSAGVYRSPQLLMLSGIGPSDQLTELGIPVLRDLPVGQFFKDHLAYSGLAFYTKRGSEPKKLEQNIRDYLNSKGQLTTTGALALAFVQNNRSEPVRRPDIEIALFEFSQDYGFPYKVNDPSKLVSVVPVVLHPKSLGSLTLNSSDPFIYPVIDPKFLSDTDGEDRKTMLLGISYSLNLLNTVAFKGIDAKLVPVHLPQCKNYAYFSSEYWNCHINHLSGPFNHPFGTCRMGPDGVVDHKLRVHGVENLMVADASVIPVSISGHTSAPSMMIGEKAAHIIRFG